jgi:hypothetical protein
MCISQSSEPLTLLEEWLCITDPIEQQTL